MLKTILLVLDEHGVEHAAVDLAVRWAAKADALLVGLGVIDESLVNVREAIPIGAQQAKLAANVARRAEMERNVEHQLSRLAQRCAQEQVAFKPLEDFGSPTADILREAQRFDLIVVPRQANYFHVSTENSTGGVLWEVVRHSVRPVVAVPAHAAAGQSVLIAYDGSLQAARALQAFESSGLGQGRDVHVVAVDADRQDAARQGDRAVEFLDYHGVIATLHTEACDAHVAERIMQCAYRVNAGLIVLGAHGRPSVCEYVMGSVARALMSHCTLPLFLYH